MFGLAVVGLVVLSGELSDSGSELIPSIPGGGLSVLGGTTSGLYEGKSAVGTSSIGMGKLGALGSNREGSLGGSTHSIT